MYDIIGLLSASLNVMFSRMGLTASARAFKSQFGIPLGIIGPLLEHKPIEGGRGVTLQTKSTLQNIFTTTLCFLQSGSNVASCNLS